jgi:hypothetical protein
VRAEAVVVEVEVLQGHVGCQEGNQRRLCVQPKGIVVDVDCVEFREVENGGEEGGKRVGDLAEESAGEDIGKVCDLADLSMVAPQGTRQTSTPQVSYPQCLLCCKNIAEQFACANAQRVTENAHFLNVLHGAQVGNVRLDVFSSVQLQTPPFEGEDFGRGSHIENSRSNMRA